MTYVPAAYKPHHTTRAGRQTLRVKRRKSPLGQPRAEKCGPFLGCSLRVKTASPGAKRICLACLGSRAGQTEAPRCLAGKYHHPWARVSAGGAPSRDCGMPAEKPACSALKAGLVKQAESRAVQHPALPHPRYPLARPAEGAFRRRRCAKRPASARARPVSIGRNSKGCAGTLASNVSTRMRTRGRGPASSSRLFATPIFSVSQCGAWAAPTG